MRLATTPDVREVPIFWRIVPLDGTALERPELETWALRLAPVAPVRIVAPEDGAEFFDDQPPCLIWDENHNERYRVVFAGNDFLGEPRVTSGPEFDIDRPTPGVGSCPGGAVGFQWQLPDAIWTRIVALARQRPARDAWFAVLARDALDRLSFTRAHRLVVIEGGTGKRRRGAGGGR